jgi:hypothetical protein
MLNDILTDMAKKRTTGKSTATGDTSRTTKKLAAKKPAASSSGCTGVRAAGDSA